MDDRTRALLDDLATTCAKVTLRQEDWQKLYRVCLYAHAQGGLPDLRTIKAYLVGKGCSKSKAGFLGRQFEHLTQILQLHDQQAHKATDLKL